MAKYVMTKTSDNEFRWVLKAGNGEPLLTSETFTTKQNCRASIESSKKNLGDDSFKKLDSVRHEPYFTQVAGNHQPLATSEMYASAQSRDNGIESVRKNAPDAQIEDLT